MSDTADVLELLRTGNTLEARRRLAAAQGAAGDTPLALNAALFGLAEEQAPAHLQEARERLLALLDAAEGARRAMILHNLGCLALAEEDILTAKLRFGEAVRLDPGLAPAWHNLGFAHELMAESDQARDAYRRALEADPGSALSRCNLALLELQEGREAEGRRALEELAAADPDNAGLLHQLCKTLLARGSPEAAREVAALLERHAGREHHPELQECLGWALLLAQEPDRAQAVFQAVLAGDERRVAPRVGLMKILARRGDFTALLAQAQRLEAFHPAPEVSALIDELKAL